MVTIKLPKFRRTPDQIRWVEDESRTARLIQTLWRASEPKQRRDPNFIILLIKCGWTNVRNDGSGVESTRLWRNRQLADYLRVPDRSEQLADALSTSFSLKRSFALTLLESSTGITHYYKALRPGTLAFLRKNASEIGKCFEEVSSRRLSAETKITRIVERLEGIAPITIRGGKVSPLNSTTPALACLDPHRRFPIMNKRTARLLRPIGAANDRDGALALSALIGRNGVRNSLELDVYALTENFSRIPVPRRVKLPAGNFRDVGIKSELDSLSTIVGNSATIRKEHNRLTNRLRKYLLWRHVVPKESRFDVLIQNWKRKRHLLIEAKTTCVGTAGRTQIRQAIGQLFDYRFKYFPNARVDLAVLLPSKPPPDIKKLLRSVAIECLWFEGRQLQGTVEL